MRFRSSLCCSAMLLLVLSGCALERLHRPVTLGPRERLMERSIADSNGSTPTGDVVPVGATREGPRHVLVLSGGGANGAYTAGVLNGWTASGTRPEFDVVTGISTGALIAPFAFLGPAYDNTLRYSYTDCEQSDIYTRRWLFSLLWADSLADSTPLRNKIAHEITVPVLDQIAEAHRTGRRLFVGTTDLDSKKLVVWDMGAIAASSSPNRLQLFRSVLLASASIPGLLPPVELEIDVDGQRHTELHVDGSVSASLFLQPSMLGVKPGQEQAGNHDNVNVHVIVAGQLELPRRAVKRRLTTVLEESVGGVLQSQLEGDLLKTYLLTRFAGAEFQVAALSKEFVLQKPSKTTGPLAFETTYMTQVFDNGYQQAASNSVWQHAPESLRMEEQVPPRSSLEFTIREAANPPAGATVFPFNSRPNPSPQAFMPPRIQNPLRTTSRSNTVVN